MRKGLFFLFFIMSQEWLLGGKVGRFSRLQISKKIDEIIADAQRKIDDLLAKAEKASLPRGKKISREGDYGAIRQSIIEAISAMERREGTVVKKIPGKRMMREYATKNQSAKNEEK